MDHRPPKDQLDTGERKAIAEAVEDEVTARLGATPTPASRSSTSQVEMEAIAMKECQKCHRQGGPVWEIWQELNPIRQRLWMLVGALILLGALWTTTMPRISAKLDKLDELAKDMSALKVQVDFLIARPSHSENALPPTQLAKGVDP